jgi:LemA protein
MKKTLLLIAVSVLAFSASGCSYNDLTAKQQNVKARWSDVESRLQRRSDLIGNMFETAKAVAVNEQEVFGKIAEARSKLLDATKPAPAGAEGDRTPEQRQAIIDASNSFGGTIGRLLSLQENYPQLKSDANFMKVQDELSGTENRINVAREDYNKAAQDYNTVRSQFPGVLTASLFGFKEEPYFKADEGAKEAPKLDANSVRKTN